MSIATPGGVASFDRGVTAVVKMGDVEMPAARLSNAAMRAILDSPLAVEFERMELIEGVLIEMPPAKSRHARAHSKLFAWLAARIDAPLEALFDPAIFLGDYTMVGPDIAVLPSIVRNEDAEPTEIRLAVEVADSTLCKDLRQKARLYGVHGVPEYWVIDVEDRLLHIHRAPGSGGYGEIEAVAWETPVAPLFAPDLAVTLADIIPEDPS